MKQWKAVKQRPNIHSCNTNLTVCTNCLYVFHTFHNTAMYYGMFTVQFINMESPCPWHRPDYHVFDISFSEFPIRLKWRSNMVLTRDVNVRIRKNLLRTYLFYTSQMVSLFLDTYPRSGLETRQILVVRSTDHKLLDCLRVILALPGPNSTTVLGA